MKAYKITIISRGVWLSPRFSYTIVEANITAACKKAVCIANRESREKKRVVEAQELGEVAT